MTAARQPGDNTRPYNDIGKLDPLAAPGRKGRGYPPAANLRRWGRRCAVAHNRLARVDIPNGMHTEYTMADGSGEPSETFTVTQAQTGANAIKPLERTEATVTILQGGTVISTQTAPRGEEVHIAPGGFKVGSDYDPGRTLASEATVLAGIGDSTIELEGGLTLSSQRLVHTIESEGGGRVILAEGGDPDAAAFLNTAVSSRASQPVAPWRRVVFQAIPDVGYFPQYPLESLVIFGNMYRFLHDSYSPVGETIAFPKMYELTLIALPKGGGNPECVGYIKAQEAKKYYLPGAEVQLTAIEQPNGYFIRWRSGPWGWLPGQTEEDSVPIEWLDSPTIMINMDHTQTVVAEFCRCLHKGTVHNGSLEGDVSLSEGVGYKIYDPGPNFGCVGWMHRKIKSIGKAWAASHNYPFEVGQISKSGGGPSEGGSSSHQNGLDVDVRYIRSDHQQQRFAFGVDNMSEYDKAATQELVNLFMAQDAILLVADDRAQLTSGSVPQDYDRGKHFHHFHVRFRAPECVEN